MDAFRLRPRAYVVVCVTKDIISLSKEMSIGFYNFLKKYFLLTFLVSFYIVESGKGA